MDEFQKKNSVNLRSKHRPIRPYSQFRANTNWQRQDYKVNPITPPYKCLCSICFKQTLKISGVLTQKLPIKISVDKTKFLFSCLVSKGLTKAMNILIVDSCFYSQSRPQRIFYSQKGVIVQSKFKQITEQYVFNRLVQQTKIQNTEDATSLLSKNNKMDNNVPYVNARYCNVLIPKYSQFNQSHKSIFNVRVYRKGDAPDFTARKSNDKTYSTIVHYRDGTLVLLSESNFDKMMKDRREGNPHVVFIQSYVKPKISSKKNYYGLLLTNYNTKEKYNIKQGLYESARANIMKYLNKDPFAIDNIAQDSLGTQDLATFYMYRIIEYLKQTQDIIVNSITLAWMYSINNQLFLSYCSELDYDFDQKIEIWKAETNYSRHRSRSKILAEAISDESSFLYEKWQSIKSNCKEKSMEKIQRQRKMYTDKSEEIFQMMYPDGDFQSLRSSVKSNGKSSASKSSRLSKTSMSFKKPVFGLGSSLKVRNEIKGYQFNSPKWPKTSCVFNVNS